MNCSNYINDEEDRSGSVSYDSNSEINESYVTEQTESRKIHCAPSLKFKPDEIILSCLDLDLNIDFTHQPVLVATTNELLAKENRNQSDQPNRRFILLEVLRDKTQWKSST